MCCMQGPRSNISGCDVDKITVINNEKEIILLKIIRHILEHNHRVKYIANAVVNFWTST